MCWESISTPGYSLLDYQCGGAADGGKSAKSPEPLDVWGAQVESEPIGKSNVAQPDIQLHDRGDGVAHQECPADDGASLALWEALRGEVSTSAPATDQPTSSSSALETDGLDLPLHTAGPSPVSPSTDSAPGDQSLLEREIHVQQPELSDDLERDITGQTLIESALQKQDPTSTAACDIYASDDPSGGVRCDRAQSSYSTNTTDDIVPSGSDDDDEDD